MIQLVVTADFLGPTMHTKFPVVTAFPFQMDFHLDSDTVTGL